MSLTPDEEALLASLEAVNRGQHPPAPPTLAHLVAAKLAKSPPPSLTSSGLWLLNELRARPIPRPKPPG